jgi:hypothetical protein
MSQSNAGNLVRIEGGCATVTGYKLRKATVPSGDGKAEARLEARSQDIGSIVLVVAAGKIRWANFSVKEKDEARALTVFNVAECLHSRLPRRMKVFLSSPSGTGLS